MKHFGIFLPPISAVDTRAYTETWIDTSAKRYWLKLYQLLW